ncbi:sodium/potassium/calcium exchanger 2-like isoform X2 [Seriola lalandi dorsalis]|uniref:sodium/potassium/calcium exchanger 2-like isoform X2 n=1 Tax=Seriola lalandi dorsalis TaxID=1841481 RepID=UPI000C6F910F|nr:sodium/potassium/calcium exchanger 2-like isoform X2 [Seriola lalandi dorsalis]
MDFMLPIRSRDMMAPSSSAPLLGPHNRCTRYHYQGFKRKLRPGRIMGFIISLVVVSTVCSWSALSLATTMATELESAIEGSAEAAVPQRTLLQYHNLSAVTKDTPVAMRSSDEELNHGDYPTDYFSVEERRQGFVVFHMFGMLYMFIALAIVCDEFFVPALTVITEKLEISDDVAGATFMAAGGSAPELFTSVIGVFVSHSNVGIGTIVGSAVFNILFVIGMCALFSKEVLNLTWWPLFRDVSFYIIGLLMLIYFFLDNQITVGESISLLMCYTCYVTFMKFNAKVELLIKSTLGSNQVDELETAPKLESDLLLSDVVISYGAQVNAPGDDENKLMAKPRLQREGSCASLHNSLMRNSIFQLMIHTLDPLSDEGRFKEKASILHKMAKQKCKEDAANAANAANGIADKNIPNSSNVAVEVTPPMNGVIGGDEGDEEEDEDQPLSLAWPDTTRKRLTYLLILPIVFPLWLTLPDVRRETAKRFFPITFIGAICWIAFFSYLMVWWAHQVGETFWITEEIMGLTILAAGTSIPDLITSVIVARKGLGDMAVSSSVGSNIFDITVGLPFPWLLFNIINDFKPVEVSSNGLFCAIVLLFLMLLFVIISIAACKWRMSKILGLLMFLLYFVFLIVSVMLEDKVISCPVTV